MPSHRDETSSPKKSEVAQCIIFLKGLANLMGVKGLDEIRSNEYAAMILERFPLKLLDQRALRSIAARSQYFPNPHELIEALQDISQNRDREHQQRQGGTEGRTPDRVAWAKKILTPRAKHQFASRGFHSDAQRIARLILTPEEIAQCEATVPAQRPAGKGEMPMSEVIKRVCKYLEPDEAKRYRQLMALPTEQRSEEERDEIFGLVRTMTKRAGITGPVADWGAKRAGTSDAPPPPSTPSPLVPQDEPASAGLVEARVGEAIAAARELSEAEVEALLPVKPRRNRLEDEI